jgi:hypothetical protein
LQGDNKPGGMGEAIRHGRQILPSRHRVAQDDCHMGGMSNVSAWPVIKVALFGAIIGAVCGIAAGYFNAPVGDARAALTGSLASFAGGVFGGALAGALAASIRNHWARLCRR